MCVCGIWWVIEKEILFVSVWNSKNSKLELWTLPLPSGLFELKVLEMSVFVRGSVYSVCVCVCVCMYVYTVHPW